MNLRIGEHRRTHKADFWEIARGRGAPKVVKEDIPVPIATTSSLSGLPVLKGLPL